MREVEEMFVVNIIAFVLVCIGAINWGLVGICGFNLVSFITGSDRNIAASVIYVLVCISAIWLIVALFVSGGAINFMR